MADINSVTIAGRLTRDSELRYSSSGLCILKFSIAVNSRKKDGQGEWHDEVNYFDVVMFGKRAEALQNYLAKGRALAVTGELRQDRWNSDGQARSRVSILANNVMFLGGGSAGSSSVGVTTTEEAIRKDVQSESQLPSNVEAPLDKNTGGGVQQPQTVSYQEDDFEDDIPF